jgi:hypothetical protein
MLIIKDFVLFLKDPSPKSQIEIKSPSSFIRLVWRSFLIILFFNLIVFLLISIPLKYFNLFPSQMDLNFSFYIILKISILLPIIEELIFRLPLRISKLNLAISSTLIFFLILNKFNTYLALLISIAIFIILILFINIKPNTYKWVEDFYSKHFLYIYYFQAFIFGFLHLTNYKLDFRYFYFFPLFIISYIISGCFFGYIRLKYTNGIFLCISTHIFINSIYCLLLYH